MRRAGVAALAAVAMAACGAANGRTSPAPSATRLPVVTATATPGTLAPTPAGLGVTVTAVGAAAGPTGTLVFVVVDNTAPAAASGVRVDVVARSANGRGDVTGSAVIANLAAGESQGVAVPIQVPGGDALGTVSATATAAGQTAYVNALAASGARFVDDPITPSVAVTVLAAHPVAGAVVVAVCFAGTTVVGGGTRSPVSLAGGSQTLSIPAALTAAPTSCTGFARP